MAWKSRGISSRMLAPFVVLAAVMSLVLTPGTASSADKQKPPKPPKAHVVLWNTLDSSRAIAHSRVGPAGTLTTGGFTQGRFGNAFTADFSQPFGLTFPASVINNERGTIEFWAQLGPAFQGGIQGGGGGQPTFVAANDAATDSFGWGMSFTDNNGLAGGGLTGGAGKCQLTSTSSAGGNRYEDVLGSAVHTWHHYALIWDSRGLAGIDDGTRGLAIFLDGVLVSSLWQIAPGCPPTFPALSPGSTISLLGIDRINFGSASIDNLIVWDCATTTFHIDQMRPGKRPCIQ